MSDPSQSNPQPPPLPDHPPVAPAATAQLAPASLPDAALSHVAQDAPPSIPLLGQAQGRAARRFHLEAACPHCEAVIDSTQLNAGLQTCFACKKSFESVFFDPPPIPSRIARLNEAGPQGGTPCATHAGNLAHRNCSRCGVFMCDLCRIEIEAIELCPSCFQRQRQANEIMPLRMEYPDFRGHAMALGILSVFPLFLLGFLLGPLAIFYSRKGLQLGREMGNDAERKALYAAAILGALGTVFSLAFFGFTFYEAING